MPCTDRSTGSASLAGFAPVKAVVERFLSGNLTDRYIELIVAGGHCERPGVRFFANQWLLFGAASVRSGSISTE
jgi:hypothetical protein